jgi:hypothetical protein
MRKSILILFIVCSIKCYSQNAQEKAEEKYSNVSIWNDNTIATLFFNYSFWIGGKETNWGIETWQLLFNGKEWKIMSALFSTPKGVTCVHAQNNIQQQQ